jgi:hypothetical protein
MEMLVNELWLYSFAATSNVFDSILQPLLLRLTSFRYGGPDKTSDEYLDQKTLCLGINSINTSHSVLIITFQYSKVKH